MSDPDGWLGAPERRLVGAAAQLVRVERAVLGEGPAAGSPVLLVRNPAGISFEVMLDRALDIGWADALGSPLAWAAPRGRVDARRFDPRGSGWAATFGGGLLSTCGLASSGSPSVDQGVEYGLHGRIGHQPAESVTWQVDWAGSERSLRISGEVLETALGEPALLLRRTITASCCRPQLTVSDVVVNVGFRPAGHMFRHHYNLGHPLVSPGLSLRTDAVPAGTRGNRAPAPLPADPGEAADRPVDELVWYGLSASGRLVLTSPASGLAAELDWTTDSFPLLVIWRDPSPGVNVLGIEPSTSRDEGRCQARRDGELVVLEPGQERRYASTVCFRRLADDGSPGGR